MSGSREDADLETSSEGYAGRFAGPVGTWFLELQARTTLRLLDLWPRATVLEVGGGHAQLAQPLADAGYGVTVFGSDPACGRRVAPLLEAGRVSFASGDLLALPYGEGAFDVVTSFRLLAHTQRWGDLVGELTRVARRAVVVDYPTRRSLNVLSGLLFDWKKGVEGNTRPFRVFREGEIRGAFAARGFAVTGRRPQFLFPMALHRALGSAKFARALEAAARGCGLTRALGSPVILRVEPRG